MPATDNSYAARLRRQKGAILADFHLVYPTKREQGVGGGVDASTLLARQAGEGPYLRESPGGAIVVELPCGCDGKKPIVPPTVLLYCSSSVILSPGSYELVNNDPSSTMSLTLNEGAEFVNLSPGQSYLTTLTVFQEITPVCQLQPICQVQTISVVCGGPIVSIPTCSSGPTQVQFKNSSGSQVTVTVVSVLGEVDYILNTGESTPVINDPTSYSLSAC
jgi:hypothetical protein